ncbi:hypothetical protein SDC9_114855 [bioreactor metagenome]|uniref:Uncharacterized protein n=1 Tax=bioreactor metagenome TaxID=1076179 RepID=A0A645BR65_9ZZZZ
MVSPDSTVGNDRELSEDDKKSGYTLEPKFGVQFRVDNLDRIHPDDLPDYLELAGRYSALFSRFDNVMETAKDFLSNTVTENPLAVMGDTAISAAMVLQNSINPFGVSKGPSNV